MDDTATNSLDVTLAAIDGGYLVLESTDDKTRFRWPLDKIPRPLEIGSRLTLELQKSQELTSDGPDFVSAAATTISGGTRNSRSSNPSTATPSSGDKDSRMRRLLEELVN